MVSSDVAERGHPHPKTEEKKQKQAGAGAVPSSGLVDSWVKFYYFFVGDPKQETGWSLDEVKIMPW